MSVYYLFVCIFVRKGFQLMSHAVSMQNILASC